MKRLFAAIAGFLCLTGCPGVGNVRHGHVPPGQLKKLP